MNNKKNKGKILIVIGATIATISIVFLLLVGETNFGNSILFSSTTTIDKDTTYGGVKFTNNKLIVKKGNAKYTCTVTNSSNKDIKREKFHMILKDKKGKELKKVLLYISGGLKKGETRIIIASIGGNYKDAYYKQIVD